jgi:hypothetical protein
MYTCNTAGMGRGMPRCAKTQNRTQTRITRFGSTAGKPVPVFNPSAGSWMKMSEEVMGGVSSRAVSLS